MKTFLKGFTDFIMKGNVLDLAVAVVIGAAFNKIIESLVGDIITPLILNPAIKAAQVENLAALSFSGIQYGLFLSAVINFLVIAFCLYTLIQSFEKVKKKALRKALIEQELQAPVVVIDPQIALKESIDKLTEVINNKL